MVTAKFKCPVCGEKFELETDSEIGEIMSCPECDADLKIISFVPPKAEAVADYSGTYENEDDENDGNNID